MEELLDQCTNTSLTKEANIKLLQKRTPHSLHEFAIPKKIIQVFLCLPTKNTAKGQQARTLSLSIYSVHMTQQNKPNKRPDFLQNLNPPNHIKNRLPNWGGSNRLNHDLHENLWLGLRLQIQTSLPPTLKSQPSSKERREVTYVVSLLDKRWRNPKEKDTEVSNKFRKSEIGRL